MAFFMVRKYCILILSLFIFLAACTTKPAAKSGSSPVKKSSGSSIAYSTLETDILEEVNRYRRSKGKPTLRSNSVMDTEAAVHSQRMASGKTPFGHNGFDGRIARVEKRIGYLKQSAENVAYGKFSARQVVQEWLQSPGHKRNIEGNFNLAGIGVSRNGKGIIYYTMIFSLKP
ncbi:CAP domain-containing protein [Flavihumibacter rivuli]|uniref:CAP domain-containing protein n=1 Tax=Flavihumibacter rivuli TaxID=2838156 RepID=UPI001BDE2472|nr:CAP domain-containing protein [Flavihumibacter rivuli]ULQ57826.1 CAP domain-containing protein [Flavihumibacter rivuli]